MVLHRPFEFARRIRQVELLSNGRDSVMSPKSTSDTLAQAGNWGFCKHSRSGIVTASISNLRPSTWSGAGCLGWSQSNCSDKRFRRGQGNQRDTYDYQGRNIAEQMSMLIGARQRLHSHDAGVDKARPSSKGDEAAMLRGAM